MTGSISIAEELSAIQFLLKEWFFTFLTIGVMCLFCVQGIAYLAYVAWSERTTGGRAAGSSSDLGPDVESQGGNDEADLNI